MKKRSSRHALAEVHQDSRMSTNSNIRENSILRPVLNKQADSRPDLQAQFFKGRGKDGIK
jgi:hypothetical protein